jgi:putative Mg2+ transporter-C (MgtC) family protein
MKEGLSVRGLTTAASIWMTAAIGVLAGVGFYIAVLIGTIFTLGVVSVFRWVEAIIPTLAYAHLTMRFRRDMTIPESELLEMIMGQGFSVANMSYSSEQESDFFEYSMTIRTPVKDNMRRLSSILAHKESLIGFELVQTGD